MYEFRFLSPDLFVSLHPLILNFVQSFRKLERISNQQRSVFIKETRKAGIDEKLSPAFLVSLKKQLLFF